MTSAATTIKLFGVYVILTGLTLLLAPNLLLAMFGTPEAKEIWIRVLGALAIVVGYYYWACGAGNARAFFSASVRGRFLFFALGLALILLAGAPWTLALFGLVDVAGAVWTLAALRAEAKTPVSA